MIVISRTIATTYAVVAQRGSDVVAVSIVEGVVTVEIVVIVVGGHPIVVMPIMVTIIPIVVMVRMMVSPSPTIGETVVIPAISIVVRTVGVAWPPPVIAHVNAYTPVIWIVIIPVKVGVERIVITPSAVKVAVEATNAGCVIIIVVVILIIIVVGNVGITG